MDSNSDVPIRQAEFYLYIWERRIFYIFLPKAIFDLRRGSPEGVMIRLEVTDESSLSDGSARLSIRTVIGQFPLLKSIFRLLKEIDADISKIAMQRYELYFWHCPAMSICVHLCPAMSSYCAEKACIYQKKSVTLQRKNILTFIFF